MILEIYSLVANGWSSSKYRLVILQITWLVIRFCLNLTDDQTKLIEGHPKMTPLVPNEGRTVKFDLQNVCQIWLYKLLIKKKSVLYGFNLHFGGQIDLKLKKNFFFLNPTFIAKFDCSQIQLEVH